MLSWTFNHIQKFNFIPQVFGEILRFKESCILICFEVDFKSKIFGKMLFLQNVQKNIGTLYCCIFMDKTCQKSQNLTLGTFKISKPSPSEFIFKNWNVSFFLLYDVKLHREKIEKTDDPENCIADKWENGRSQIARTLLLRWVSN